MNNAWAVDAAQYGLDKIFLFNMNAGHIRPARASYSPLRL